MVLQKGSQGSYYIPAEDSFFLEEYIRGYRGSSALDIGTGSGIIAKALAENFDLVVATDIARPALDRARKDVRNCICCNAADALRASFDLVVCNMPYLPSEDISDPAVDGLQGGTVVPSMIIRSACQRVSASGRMVFLTSSLADYESLMRLAGSMGFDVTLAARKKLFYEDLVIVECTRK